MNQVARIVERANDAVLRFFAKSWLRSQPYVLSPFQMKMFGLALAGIVLLVLLGALMENLIAKKG